MVESTKSMSRSKPLWTSAASMIHAPTMMVMA